MNYLQFLEKLIDDGIEAVKADYTEPKQKEKLEGSVLGFERCRNKTPEQLKELLAEATIATQKAFNDRIDNYWYVRCQEAEIEWVCNCVSAMLLNEHVEPIITPTARGAMKAAQLVGIS